MYGINFDTNKLQIGLPVMWSFTPGEYRYGLISDFGEESIIILAVDHKENFKEINYHITEFAEFELLGEWEELNNE
jgi:hypothetical protein